MAIITAMFSPKAFVVRMPEEFANNEVSAPPFQAHRIRISGGQSLRI